MPLLFTPSSWLTVVPVAGGARIRDRCISAGSVHESDLVVSRVDIEPYSRGGVVETRHLGLCRVGEVLVPETALSVGGYDRITLVGHRGPVSVISRNNLLVVDPEQLVESRICVVPESGVRVDRAAARPDAGRCCRGS